MSDTTTTKTKETEENNTNNLNGDNPQDSNKNSKDFEALRKSNQKLQKQIDDLLKEKDDAEKEKLKEKEDYKALLEKSEARVKELEGEIQTTKRQSVLEKELQKSGINGELLDLVLPSIQSQIEFGDDGNPQNLSNVVEELKTARPSLFAEQTKTAPAGKVGAGVVSSGASKEGLLSQEEIERIVSSGDATLIQENADKIKASVTE